MKSRGKLSLLILIVAGFSSLAVIAQASPSDKAHNYKEIVSTHIEKAPTIDGVANDLAWSKCTPIQTFDSVAGVTITVQSVHTDDEIYFLASYADKTENRRHKTLKWEPVIKRYLIGPEREDTLIFKWNLEPYLVDLTLSGDKPYHADIWYWKG